MVGVDDLEHVAKAFELARHPARLALGKLLLRGVGSAAEIGQREHVAERILRQHAIGRARRSAPAMLGHGQLDDDLLALARLVHILHCAARHEAFRKMVIEVAHPRQAELVERLLQLGAHAVERLAFGEQRVEDIGAHRRFLAQGKTARHPRAGGPPDKLSISLGSGCSLDPCLRRDDEAKVWR